MAPSQDLRYEWSPFYRPRIEHPWMAGLVVASPMLSIFALVYLGFLIESQDIRKIFAVSLMVEAFVTSFVLFFGTRWFDRCEDRRFQAFLPRAKAHGGWWFVRAHGRAQPTIVHADELESDFWMVGLMEPLDFLRDDHHEVIEAEIRRLHELARGADQVASQHRQHVGRLEALLQPM